MKSNFCIKPFDTLWINPDGSVCICCKNPDKISLYLAFLRYLCASSRNCLAPCTITN